MAVGLCPVEEIIWSKGFVTERERYDGADVMHLLRARADDLDWERLVRRYGEHWRLLLNYLILFGYVYPGEAATIPQGVMNALLARLKIEQRASSPHERVCRGTLLSREQYLIDVEDWGYADAQLDPDVRMTEHDIAHWTAAIDDKK